MPTYVERIDPAEHSAATVKRMIQHGVLLVKSRELANGNIANTFCIPDGVSFGLAICKPAPKRKRQRAA